MIRTVAASDTSACIHSRPLDIIVGCGAWSLTLFILAYPFGGNHACYFKAEQLPNDAGKSAAVAKARKRAESELGGEVQEVRARLDDVLAEAWFGRQLNGDNSAF